MRKYTPGPWKVCRKQIPVVLGSDGSALLSWQKYDRQRLTFEANAHLIAAAPDLLKALEEITDELQYQYDTSNGEDSRFEKIRMRLVKQSRAAIAKAEGK